MTLLPKLLLSAALLLGAVGLVLAVAQPGDLGDDDADTETAQSGVTDTETAQSGFTDTDTEAGTDTDADDVTVPDTGTETVTETNTETTGITETETVAGADGSTPTTMDDGGSAGSGVADETGVSRGGTGLDADADGDRAGDTVDGLANTGGTSAAGLALLLGLAGLALRRRTA